MIAGLKVGPVLALAIALSVSQTTRAADDMAEVRAGIQKTFDTVHRLVMSSASKEEIAKALYTDDLMVVGEGEKNLYPNLRAFRPVLDAGVKASNGCKLELLDPIRHSGNLAAVFVTEHCTAGSFSDARVLYVLRNGPHGWRVTMEMYGFGELGVPQ